MGGHSSIRPSSTVAVDGAGGAAAGVDGAPGRGSPPSLRAAGPFRWAPLAPLVGAVSSGILVDRYVEPCATMTWAMLAIAAANVAVLAMRRSTVSTLAVAAAFCALGGGWHHDWWSDRGPDDLARVVTEAPRPAWVRGVIRESLGVRREGPDWAGASVAAEDSAPRRDRTRFVVDLTSLRGGRGWRPVSGRAILIAAGDRGAIRGGEAIEAIGQLAPIPGPLNPGEFDYRRYLRSQGIDLRMTVDEPEGLKPDAGAAGSTAGRLLGRLRAWTRERLVGGVSPEIEPLAAALLLGRREGVEPEVNDAFARTGTTHLLAVSGLHMQILAAALLIAARACGLPRRPSYLGVAMATIAYAVLVGPAPSVVRSTVMTSTFCLAAIAGRITRPANTLALAALVTLGVNPTYLFDVGCQLSFLAIAALAWLVGPARDAIGHAAGALRDRLFGPPSKLDDLERKFEPRWKTRLRSAAAWLAGGVLTSTVVWLAALPLVALRFHIVAPIGILLNIPLIPITSTALLLGGIGLGLSAAWGPLGLPASQAAGWLLDLTERIVLWGVARPWGYRFVAGPSWAWVVVFYAMLGLAAVSTVAAARAPRAGRLRRQGPWWLLAAWSLAGWVLAAFPAPPPTPEADVLAVGHGLAVIIHTPGGRALLYDGGRMGDPTVGRRIIAPALWSRGITRIDEVILSHADQDHYNGLPDLLDRFAIGLVRVPPGFGGPANPAADRLLGVIRSRGIPIRPTAAPESWESGGVHLKALHPPIDWSPGAPDNARSLVLDVEHSGRHLLLTGDVEQMGLVELIAQPRTGPPPDVMLAPHHGGRTANPASLYRWAEARSVVVSQRAPRPGAADALAFLDGQGIPLWRTWRDGAIRLRWERDAIASRGFIRPAGAPFRETRARSAAASSPRRPLPFAMIGAVPLHAGVRLVIGLAGFAVGTILWALLAIVEFGAWTLVVPPRGPGRRSGDGRSGVTPQVPPCVPEPIEIPASDGVRLAGRWYPGDGSQPTGRTILLIHGFAEDSSAWETARASILNQRGWNVAALDSRGYGRSGGLHASFGGREAGDLVTWLDALESRRAERRPSVPFRAALWGRSMGAAIALRAAAQDPRVMALVLESPMVDLDAAVAALLRKRGLPLTGLLARLITRRASRIAGVSLDRPRPVEIAPRVSCPVLIVHGTDDWLVTPAELRRLADAFPSAPSRIDVPGAGHSNVVGTGRDELVGRIAEFLDGAHSRTKGREQTEEPVLDERSGML